MQPSHEILFHPVDLAAHGLNPYGQPLYRVVWADSRKTKVICNGRRHILPRYQHGEEGSCAGKWILEKWAPAEVIVGLTREQYEGLLAAVPNAAREEYPEQGDWELSYVFEGNVDEIFLHKQLSMHEWRQKKLTMADRTQEMEQAEELKEKTETELFNEKFEAAREEILCQ